VSRMRYQITANVKCASESRDLLHRILQDLPDLDFISFATLSHNAVLLVFPGVSYFVTIRKSFLSSCFVHRRFAAGCGDLDLQDLGFRFGLVFSSVLDISDTVGVHASHMSELRIDPVE